MKAPAWRLPAVVVGGLVLIAGLGVLGVLVGTTEMSWALVLRALAAAALPDGWVDTTGLDAVDHAIVIRMRAPRVVLGALIGACLALAGALMQGLFRNPLASPGIVGTSAGASTGALLAFSLGLSLRSMFYVPTLAVLGALISLVVVTRVATRDGVMPVSTLLLAGVALTAFIGAINSWIIARSWAEWEVARRIAFWMLGGITDRTWVHVAMLAPCFVLGTAFALYYARDLDLMLEGDDSARALGVPVEHTRRGALVVAAVLTGGAVAVSGVVGFVGLVIPHMVRLLVGPRHRPLMVASAITGAWFLIGADLIARVATRPVELHLGVVTASIGAPFFLVLLRRHRAETSLL